MQGVGRLRLRPHTATQSVFKRDREQTAGRQALSLLEGAEVALPPELRWAQGHGQVL